MPTEARALRGKARAALNSLKHGLRAQVILSRAHELDGDHPYAFASLLSDLVAEFAPVSFCESFCVETMAVAAWRLRLVVQKEYDLAGQPDADNLADAVCDFGDEVNAWAREQDPSSPAPDPLPRPAPHPTMPHPDKFLPVVRYEAHLMRQYNQAFRQLEHLRAGRLAGALPRPHLPPPRSPRRRPGLSPRFPPSPRPRPRPARPLSCLWRLPPPRLSPLVMNRPAPCRNHLRSPSNHI